MNDDALDEGPSCFECSWIVGGGKCRSQSLELRAVYSTDIGPNPDYRRLGIADGSMQPLRFRFRGFELGLQPRASKPISDGLKQIGGPPLGDFQITLQLWSCRLQLRHQA
jgi:hypothetical protein